MYTGYYHLWQIYSRTYTLVLNPTALKWAYIVTLLLKGQYSPKYSQQTSKSAPVSDKCRTSFAISEFTALSVQPLSVQYCVISNRDKAVSDCFSKISTPWRLLLICYQSCVCYKMIKAPEFPIRLVIVNCFNHIDDQISYNGTIFAVVISHVKCIEWESSNLVLSGLGPFVFPGLHNPCPINPRRHSTLIFCQPLDSNFDNSMLLKCQVRPISHLGARGSS